MMKFKKRRNQRNVRISTLIAHRESFMPLKNKYFHIFRKQGFWHIRINETK
jgi:hypothetical protein